MQYHRQGNGGWVTGLMGLFWLRTGYTAWRTGGRHTRRIRNGLSLQSALERTHILCRCVQFNWIISRLQISASKMQVNLQRSAACEWIKCPRPLHVHNSLIVAQISLEFDTTTTSPLVVSVFMLLSIFIASTGFVFVSWLICYNICSPWEPRGQLIETTLNLLILSQIKRRFINTHRRWTLGDTDTGDSGH